MIPIFHSQAHVLRRARRRTVVRTQRDYRSAAQREADRFQKARRAAKRLYDLAATHIVYAQILALSTTAKALAQRARYGTPLVSDEGRVLDATEVVAVVPECLAAEIERARATRPLSVHRLVPAERAEG